MLPMRTESIDNSYSSASVGKPTASKGSFALEAIREMY